MPMWRSLQPLLVWLAATSLLTIMLLLMLGSSWEDSLTFDEPAHIAAGYAYLRFRDARLNYEHPPLLKMLAAIPLLPLWPHFPLTSSAWQDANNGQWETAFLFLYRSGNDPHHIAALARLGPIALTVLLGFVLFLWTRQWAGSGSALLTLFLFVFSPTMLAHGRLVTTDVAAALGVTLAGFVFIHFLSTPGRKTALLSGLALGIALLCKFSTFLLVPFMAALTLLWMGLKPKRILRYLFGLVIIGLSAALLVLLFYLWTTAHYPPERQLRDSYLALFWVADGPAGRVGNESIDDYFTFLRQDRTRDLRACVGLHPAQHRPRLRRCPADLVIFLADKPLLRAWGHYLYGLVWTLARARAGTPASFPFYFLEEVSVSGRPSYFPMVYAVKEPLPFHLLTATALLLVLIRLWSSAWSLHAILNWLRGHPSETFMLGWIALYWSITINANLNIGVRHLLPAFPFTFILVSREIGQWLTHPRETSFRSMLKESAKGVWVAAILIWQCVSVVLVYPSFLAYFNEAAGGPAGGAHYVVDSNLDWGQDLRRLRRFVEAQGIEKIAVNYFGTSFDRYELGEKLILWRSALGPYQGWLAVSATVLKVAQARWDPALGHKGEDSYHWLQGKEPMAKIGYSIFVYDLRTSSQGYSRPHYGKSELRAAESGGEPASVFGRATLCARCQRLLRRADARSMPAMRLSPRRRGRAVLSS
jgi:4-amino-4-deoxy-L-arabinose transferase-like glycosyltransferase